jgi:excreted virulence factor EspC (type VII ESX diderm)
MIPELKVDTDDLRRTASALSGTAARLTGAAGHAPSPTPSPRWATVDAAGRAAESARAELTRLGADLAETARQITEAAAAYESSDARTAARLRRAR